MNTCDLRSPFTFTILCLSLFAILLIGQSGPASACNGGGCSCSTPTCSATYPCGDPCPCFDIEQLQEQGIVDVPLGETIITPVGANRAKITISGFLSLGMSGGDECSSALGQVDGIEEITSVKILDAESGALLEELPFQANAASGPSFAAEAVIHGVGSADASWLGFFGQVLGDVEKGRMLTYVLDARLKRGVGLGILAEQLRSSGLIGTAAANSDGSVNREHVHFRALGDTPVLIKPARDRSILVRPSGDVRP